LGYIVTKSDNCITKALIDLYAYSEWRYRQISLSFVPFPDLTMTASRYLLIGYSLRVKLDDTGSSEPGHFKVKLSLSFE
jgi:hypothetical protein